MRAYECQRISGVKFIPQYFLHILIQLSTIVGPGLGHTITGTLQSRCSLEVYILMSKRVNDTIKSFQIVVRITKKISVSYGIPHDGVSRGAR